ncbi:MAG: hypothetical protein IAF58_17975, partial [Leptolyngbya sp.]|nr:hypothetical protein [Candidatus Melainabacteria bacterium]
MRLATYITIACMMLTAQSGLAQGYRIQRNSSSDQQIQSPAQPEVTSFRLPASQPQSGVGDNFAQAFAEPAVRQVPQMQTARVSDAASFLSRTLQTFQQKPFSSAALAPVEVARLRGKHVTIVMDRSGSMKTQDCAIGMPMMGRFPGSSNMLSRWDWCTRQTFDLARQTAQVMPNGLTMVFFSSSDSVFHHVRPDEIPALFARNEPEGGTNLVGALKRQFDDFFKAQQMGATQPLVIAVVTDGAPDTPRALKDLIVGATQKMTSPDQISIVFLQ